MKEWIFYLAQPRISKWLWVMVLLLAGVFEQYFVGVVAAMFYIESVIEANGIDSDEYYLPRPTKGGS